MRRARVIAVSAVLIVAALLGFYGLTGTGGSGSGREGASSQNGSTSSSASTVTTSEAFPASSSTSSSASSSTSGSALATTEPPLTAGVYNCHTFKTIDRTVFGSVNATLSDCTITQGDLVVLIADCFGYPGTSAGWDPVTDSIGTNFSVISQNFTSANPATVYISRVYYGVAPKSATGDTFFGTAVGKIGEGYCEFTPQYYALPFHSLASVIEGQGFAAYPDSVNATEALRVPDSPVISILLEEGVGGDGHTSCAAHDDGMSNGTTSDQVFYYFPDGFSGDLQATANVTLGSCEVYFTWANFILSPGQPATNDAVSSLPAKPLGPV